MTPEEIRDYLGTMVEVEKECYLHERLLQTLKKRMEPLGHPNNYTKPVKEEPKSESISLVLGGFGALVGLVGGFFVGALDSGLSVDAGMTGGLIILGAVGLIVGYLMDLRFDKNESKKLQAEYDSALSNYQILVAHDKKRVEAEKRAMVYLKSESDAVLRSYNQLKQTRTRLYNANILFEKYRCFTAVSSLYEYFSAGRFKTLEDAYNQLELELRLDRISLQLDVVISKLEEIRRTQYTIYSAITEANGKLNSLVSSCNRIEAGVRNLQLQGDELNARVASLQTTSDLNLYINAMNNRELAYIRQWAAN